MKFVELKKNLMSEKKYAVYNVFGDDSFLVDSAKNLFTNYYIQKNELSKIVLSCEDLQAERLKTILSTASFLLGNRLIFLKDFSVQKNKDIFDVCIDFAKRPDGTTLVAIFSDEPVFDAKKNEKLFLSLKNQFVFVDCNKLDKPMMTKWINMTLGEENAKMANDAIDLLIDYTNGYLSRISTELQKLISYANGREITKQDVELVVNKDLEFGVFELTECLGKGDSGRVFQILNSMMQKTKTSQIVLSMIQNYFRRMFYCAITPKTNAQIASMLGVKEWAIVKAKQSAQYFSKMALKNIVEYCGELDYDIRNGKVTYKMAIDNLIFFILSNNSNAKKV